MSKPNLQLPPLHSQNPPSKFQSQSVKNLHYENQLDQSRRSEGQQFSNNKSPFMLPTDDEVFFYCQMEQQKKEDKKRNMLEQHIWEKKTATSKNSLKHFKSYQGQLNDKHQTQTAYRMDEKKLIQQALEICKKRQNKTESQQKRESVVDVLNQKKEMFLVTMSHGIIEAEIERLQKSSKEREQALFQSKLLLKQDEANFNEYLEKNKQERLAAELAAENESKERKIKEQILKELNIRLTSIRAEKSRNEELVVNYTENKYFLDKLAPKEWQEEKQEKKRLLIDENQEVWLQQQMEEQNDEDEEQRHPKRTKIKQDRQGTQAWRKQKAEQYSELTKNNQISFLQEFEDQYPIHFKSPDQLVEHFDMMEQKNLNQLSENQEIAETYETTLSNFQKIESELNKRTNALQEQKEMFKKQIEELDQQIKQMKKKSDENKNLINKEGQELTAAIEDVYLTFQSELPQITDFKSQNIIIILSQIEILMEKQLKNLRKYNPKIVEEQKKKAEKTRISNLRKKLSEKLQSEQKEKNQKNLNKLMSVTKKMEGRKAMVRSKPLIKEQKTEEVQIENNDEDEKYFQEGYDLL